MNFRKPDYVSAPTQGDYSYIPQVEILEEANAAALQISINTWLTDWIPVPEQTIHIESIEYLLTQGNKYSALIRYVHITNI